MRRTILIFPEFENSHIIDSIRAKYDPLAGLIKPHVTIVFPFEAQFGNETIERVLERRLSEIEPFELSLKGVSTQKGKFGNTLFLNIVKGAEELKDLDEEFTTTVNKISVEMIGENEESIIIIEKELGKEKVSEEEIVFDKATTDDIDELLRLRLEYMVADFGAVSERDEALMRRSLPDYYRRKLGKDLIAFVARKDDRLVAAAYLLIIEKPASVLLPHGLMGEVLSVYTEEKYRGRGICSMLIQNLIECGKEMRLDRIDLKATKDGYPIYKKQGFTDKKSHYTDMDILF